MIDFRLYLVTDRSLVPSADLTALISEACAEGVRAVQLREKDLGGRDLYETARELRAVTGELKAKLFINDRPDIARAVDADGVHCPEAGFPTALVRNVFADAIVGASVHSVEGARRAEVDGADFITFGPIFDTPSKKAFGTPKGLDALAEVVRSVSIPVFAVGGVGPERAAQCTARGAAGVAVVSAVMASANVTETVEAFRKALGGL